MSYASHHHSAVNIPFRRDRVKFIEEENAWLGGARSFEEISNLTDMSGLGEEQIRNLCTDFSLAPMYLFRISGPFTLMKFSPHSFATAEASKVFPHPGKPYKRIL